jgi:cytochrome c oxidase subunit II
MKRSPIKWVALLLFALGVRGVLGQESTQGAGFTGEAVKFRMRARKYRFDPNVITVKKGRHVRLIITALDRDHGFKLEVKLEAFNINQKLKKGDASTVEFTADAAGTFPFQCSVVCGLGHHKMKGRLVVEEQ